MTSEQSMMKYCFDVNTIDQLKYLACKYEEMQIFHGIPNTVDCKEYPSNGSKQCDEISDMIYISY